MNRDSEVSALTVISLGSFDTGMDSAETKDWEIKFPVDLKSTRGDTERYKTGENG